MITPCDEATARKAARVIAIHNNPLPVYIPADQPKLSAPSSADDAEPDDAEFDELFPKDDELVDLEDWLEAPPIEERAT